MLEDIGVGNIIDTLSVVGTVTATIVLPPIRRVLNIVIRYSAPVEIQPQNNAYK